MVALVSCLVVSAMVLVPCTVTGDAKRNPSLWRLSASTFCAPLLRSCLVEGATPKSSCSNKSKCLSSWVASGGHAESRWPLCCSTRSCAVSRLPTAGAGLVLWRCASLCRCTHTTAPQAPDEHTNETGAGARARRGCKHTTRHPCGASVGSSALLGGRRTGTGGSCVMRAAALLGSRASCQCVSPVV